MKSQGSVLFVLAWGVLLGSRAVRAEDLPVARAEPASLRRGFLLGRLTVGLRLSRWGLEESRRTVDGRLDNGNRRRNFLGSLWGLDAQQGALPAPFLEYRVVSFAGVGAAYDQVRIRTLDWANNDVRDVTAGDGDLRIRGAQGYLFGRLPQRRRVTPLARLGYGLYSSDFLETGGWAGRQILVEDTRGWFADLTLRVSLARRLDAEASYEHLWLRDVAATAGTVVGAFPLRSNVARVGLAYGF